MRARVGLMGLFDVIQKVGVVEIPQTDSGAAAAVQGIELAERRLEAAAALPGPSQMQKTSPGVELLRLARENPPFTDEAKARYLEALCEVPHEHRAALAAGVTILQVREAKKKDPQFAAAAEMAKNLAVGMAEEEAFRRAIQGVPKTIFYQGIPVGSEQEYSDALMSRILESNDPRYERKSNLKGELNTNFNWFELVQALQARSEE